MNEARTPLSVGRIFSVLGTLVLVGVISYAGVAAYYATRITPVGHAPTAAAIGPGNVLELTGGVNLSNPGPFEITSLDVHAPLGGPGGTPWLAGTTTEVVIPPYSVRTVDLTFSEPLGLLGSAAPSLLTRDQQLPMDLWANASYAEFATMALYDNSSYAWGAPFEGLAVTSGAPQAGANGSVGIPLDVRFADHATFGLAGRFTLTLLTNSGAACGGGQLPVNVPSGAAFQGSTVVVLPAACAGSVDHYAIAWAGSGFAMGLPGGRLP